jgi:hypothetical protein
MICANPTAAGNKAQLACSTPSFKPMATRSALHQKLKDQGLAHADLWL